MVCSFFSTSNENGTLFTLVTFIITVIVISCHTFFDVVVVVLHTYATHSPSYDFQIMLIEKFISIKVKWRRTKRQQILCCTAQPLNASHYNIIHGYIIISERTSRLTTQIETKRQQNTPCDRLHFCTHANKQAHTSSHRITYLSKIVCTLSYIQSPQLKTKFMFIESFASPPVLLEVIFHVFLFFVFVLYFFFSLLIKSSFWWNWICLVQFSQKLKDKFPIKNLNRQ